MSARTIFKVVALLLVLTAGQSPAQERTEAKTGRIQGHVLGFPSVDRHERLRVHSIELFLGGSGRPFSTTEVDSEGHFVFEHVPADVPAGLVKLQPVFRVGAAERGVKSPAALLMPAHLRSDATLKITLFGKGRPIVGKIVLPPGVKADTVRVWLRLLEPPFRTFHDRQGLFVNSPEYQVYSALTVNSLESALDGEGQFRIEGVGEGNYRIGAKVVGDGGESLVFNGVTEQGYPHVEYGKVTIPFMAGGESDQPQDLGLVKFDLRSKRQ